MKRSFINSRSILYLVFLLVLSLLIYTLYPFPKGIKVKEVVDGDTIVLSNGEKVRYIGIDTPEKEEPFYTDATKANQEMLNGKKITLEYDAERKDTYGRTLAYVWVDSFLVNAELIKKSLARIYFISPNLKYRSLFIDLQGLVRKKNLGIWSVTVSPEKYYIASNKSKRFVFHRPDCEWAKKIKSENRISFENRDEALDQGYSPCRTCKP